MKKIVAGLLFLINALVLNAQVINDAQLIPSNHWIYDSLYELGMEQKITGFYESTPLCVGEIKFYFNEIEYDKLSDVGKLKYKKVKDFLYSSSNLIKSDATRFDLDVYTNLEFYYKSNKNIDWTFNYFYNDNLITVPVKLGISDYFAFETDPFIGKNYHAAKEYNNFTNIPFGVMQGEFLFPRFTYGGFQYINDLWGCSLYAGKEGLQIGHTNTGSIVYNSTFETDAYVQLTAFSHGFKYNLDVIQVATQKFFFLHEVEIRPIKSLKLILMEGSLLNDDFEVRYLNPLMVMHNYSSWIEHNYKKYDLYDADGNKKGNAYWECNNCAYLSILFDYNPIKNLRFYGLYAMNELRLPNENDKKSFLNPNSQGFQLGAEYKIPIGKNDYLKPKFEGLLTSPYLYIKQEPGWSLYRRRVDNIARNSNGERQIINSWLGTPLGPDCFALQFGTEYNKNEKYIIELDYLFTAHGEMNISIFDSPTRTFYDKDGNEIEIYDYYPMAGYTASEQTDEDYDYYYKKANNYWLSGVIELQHQIALTFDYNVNKMFTTGAQAVYTFVFNNNNVKNNFEQGIQLSIYANLHLF